MQTIEINFNLAVPEFLTGLLIMKRMKGSWLHTVVHVTTLEFV